MDVEVLKSLNSPKASLKMDSKKSKKPLMEKMRRARINESLNELKELVLDALKKDASRYSKMEKADILEMTVKYLKTLQRKQSQPKDVLSLARYRSGFNECASEVTRYLMTADNVSERLQTQLLSHLASYYQTQAEPSLKHEAAHPQNPIASPVSTFPAIAPMYAPTTSHFGAFPSPPPSPFKKARDSTVMGSPVVLSNGVPAILVPHDARVHIMPLTWQSSADSALWRPW